jgi:hypothetical protein
MHGQPIIKIYIERREVLTAKVFTSLVTGTEKYKVGCTLLVVS